VDPVEDIHKLSFRSGEMGTFILADTLEHVSDPPRAMREIHRCLRADGVAIFSSVMCFPIHGYPNDYWRFTPRRFERSPPSFHWRPFFSVAHASFLTPSAASQQRTNMMSRQSKRSLTTVRHQDDGTADYRRARGANHPPLMTKLVPAKSTPPEKPRPASTGFHVQAGILSPVNGSPVGLRLRICVRLHSR
jgi:hypothetical protein